MKTQTSKTVKLRNAAAAVLLAPMLTGANFPLGNRYQLNKAKGGNMKSRILTSIVAMMLLQALAIPVHLDAQTAMGLRYTVLYTFTGGTDGAIPTAGVIQDEAGNLYGTAPFAGDLSACVE